MSKVKKDKKTISFVCDNDNADNIKVWADKWAISQSTVINIILRSFFENVEKVMNDEHQLS